MEPIQDGADRRVWHCTCGWEFEAVRVLLAARRSRAMTGFFARQPFGLVRAGQRIIRCPQCRKWLAPIAWERFLAECSAGFGP
jgi:hypothetical protein